MRQKFLLHENPVSYTHLARLKEALKQRGIFSSALMRKPVLPLNQEEKDWVALGLERSQLPEVDMTQFEDK